MTRSARAHSPARWPFWLLVAAWLCANSPQTLTYELVVWGGSARHFTHQQRLTAEVASLLAGGPAPEAVVAKSESPAKPFAPPVPAEATLKKIELAMQRAAEWLPSALRAQVRCALTQTLPDPLRAAPPHEPPRAAFVG